MQAGHSDATVYRVCKPHGLNRLPNRVGRRAVHTHRYEKRVPGHRVQLDVKFLTLKRKKGGAVRSRDRIEPTRRSSINCSPIATTSISGRSWLPGKASTITIDRTARTVEKRHTKYCGRSYASE